MLFQARTPAAKSPHNAKGRCRAWLLSMLAGGFFFQPFQPLVLSICTLRNNLHLKMTPSCESAIVQNSRWCLNTAKRKMYFFLNISFFFIKKKKKRYTRVFLVLRRCLRVSVCSFLHGGGEKKDGKCYEIILVTGKCSS